ncbi:MAG: 4Fe-4S dicluster domain-containing protein [Candidatus Omnitrophota bacterium]
MMEMRESSRKIVLIDENLCTGCENCVELCPTGILSIDEKTGKCKATNEYKCDRRRGCERVCPAEAIKISPPQGKRSEAES